MVARSVYFAIGVAAYLLVAIGLAMVFPGELLLVVLLLQAVVYLYLASVGRYGSSSVSRYLIMLIWALIPVLDLAVFYYVGKGLVAFAQLDGSGVLPAVGMPSVSWAGVMSALMPVVLIVVLGVAGVGLLRYMGAEVPGGSWEALESRVGERWEEVASTDAARSPVAMYETARDWVDGLSISWR
jgi:hypothetical protein